MRKLCINPPPGGDADICDGSNVAIDAKHSFDVFLTFLTRGFSTTTFLGKSTDVVARELFDVDNAIDSILYIPYKIFPDSCNIIKLKPFKVGMQVNIVLLK